ncbi:MAG: arylsulfatase A-like enzyme [Granulosicoccus sp.]
MSWPKFPRKISREDARNAVIPAYMGLISQIDDQVGRLMKYLEDSGQLNATLIVFTSDHGDYLGDHWLSDKELFHDQSVRVPLIVIDPSGQANNTRGTVNNALIQAIDLAPTFVEFFGGEVRKNILEGQSILPILHQSSKFERKILISEYDYSQALEQRDLGLNIGESILTMAFDGRWKLIFAEGFRPLLYDLETAPHEFHDLGDDPTYAAHVARLTTEIFAWAQRSHNRVTVTDAQIEQGIKDEIKTASYWEYGMKNNMLK